MSHWGASVPERVLPAPDRYATCPTDGLVLDYYTGVFESVYVLLHPFIRPVSLNPELFEPSTYPDRSTIAENCEPVRWSDVLALSDFTSIREIDVGLRTQIGALRAEVSSPEFAGRLAALFESHQIVPPDEGHFSDLLHDRVLGFLQQLGHSWVWVGDEFCTKRKLYWIDDLKGKEADATLGHCNVFTPDKSLLWTTHWDSCCSLVCGPREVLGQLAAEREFEGFFCTPKTHVYWGLHET
jgi:Protein of unknown function (DUF2711)